MPARLNDTIGAQLAYLFARRAADTRIPGTPTEVALLVQHRNIVTTQLDPAARRQAAAKTARPDRQRLQQAREHSHAMINVALMEPVVRKSVDFDYEFGLLNARHASVHEWVEFDDRVTGRLLAAAVEFFDFEFEEEELALVG